MRRARTKSRRAVALLASVLLIGAFLGPACSATPTVQAPTVTGVTLFEGARLITGSGDAPIENAAFIVDDARVMQVGKAGELQLPAGASRVNLTGKTVMPAIIDVHAHLMNPPI